MDSFRRRPEQRSEVKPEYDRSADSIRVLAALEGEGWTKSATPHEGWHQLSLHDGSTIEYDPQRVVESTVFATSEGADEVVEAMTHAGYTYMGTVRGDGDNLIFLRPHSLELNFDRVEGVEVKRDEEGFFLQAGTLRAEFGTVFEGDYEGVDHTKAIEIHIERVSENELDPQGRNPQAASMSFIGEIKAILQQLRNMGYETVASCPSDPRRYRIYNRMGMEPVGDGELIAKIDDLLAR